MKRPLVSCAEKQETEGKPIYNEVNCKFKIHNKVNCSDKTFIVTVKIYTQGTQKDTGAKETSKTFTQEFAWL